MPLKSSNQVSRVPWTDTTLHSTLLGLLGLLKQVESALFRYKKDKKNLGENDQKKPKGSTEKFSPIFHETLTSQA